MFNIFRGSLYNVLKYQEIFQTVTPINIPMLKNGEIFPFDMKMSKYE